MRRVEITLNETQITQKRIFISKNDRDVFPAIEAEFTIKTNIADAKIKEFHEARLMYPHDEYHIHLKKTNWFDDFKLKSRDKLVFEIEPEKGEYRLVQILRKSKAVV